jgi:hypothetical protein
MDRLLLIFSASLFLLIGALGPYFSFPGVGHESHCPFVAGEMSFCATTLEHLDHWQLAFSAVVVEILVFLGIAIVLSVWPILLLVRQSTAPPNILSRRLRRPTMLQELFSQGLLHPKAP